MGKLNLIEVKEDRHDMTLEVWKGGFFGFDIRIVKVDDENTLYNAKDACVVLAYKNPKLAYKKRVAKDEWVKLSNRNFINTNDELNLDDCASIFVTEAGLYTLILDSKAEIAEAFKNWVYGSVIPEFRKNGEYNPGKGFDPLTLTK